MPFSYKSWTVTWLGKHRRVARTFVLVAYDIPKRCIATYFLEATVLVPIGPVAEESNTPVYKSVPVKIRKAGGV